MSGRRPFSSPNTKLPDDSPRVVANRPQVMTKRKHAQAFSGVETFQAEQGEAAKQHRKAERPGPSCSTTGPSRCGVSQDPAPRADTRASLSPCPCVAPCVAGIGKVWGNKGGTAVALRFNGFKLAFVNTHLAAHAEKCEKRIDGTHPATPSPETPWHGPPRHHGRTHPRPPFCQNLIRRFRGGRVGQTSNRSSGMCTLGTTPRSSSSPRCSTFDPQRP